MQNESAIECLPITATIRSNDLSMRTATGMSLPAPKVRR